MPKFYTREIKEWATTIPIKDLLDSLGESYIKSGKEWRWNRHDSVTFKHNLWFQHSTQKGGNSVSLLTTFFEQEYDEAIAYLLREFKGMKFEDAPIEYHANAAEFKVPEAADNTRRIFAYLIKERFIAPEVIGAFVRRKLIYQGKHFGNVVFVGHNEDVQVVFAHERGIMHTKDGNSFKKTVEGSDWEHGFRWEGGSDTLFVFEAPIDMLAYITLHRENWTNHNYIAQCGTSSIFLHAFLKENPHIRNIVYALDHDIKGNAAAKRMMKEVKQKYGDLISQSIQQSVHKDWDEDLKAMNGQEAIPAQDDSMNQLMQIAFDRSIQSNGYTVVSPRDFMDQYSKILMLYSKKTVAMLSSYQQLINKAYWLKVNELGVNDVPVNNYATQLIENYSYASEQKKAFQQISDTIKELKPYFSNMMPNNDSRYEELLDELLMNTVNIAILSYPQEFVPRQERSNELCMMQSM